MFHPMASVTAQGQCLSCGREHGTPVPKYCLSEDCPSYWEECGVSYDDPLAGDHHRIVTEFLRAAQEQGPA